MHSDRIKTGVECAPHRSLLKTAGKTPDGRTVCVFEGVGAYMASRFTPKRIALARQAARQFMALSDLDLTPRRIVSPEAIDDALALDMAMSGSTNTVLHTLASGPEIRGQWLHRYSRLVSSASTGAVFLD